MPRPAVETVRAPDRVVAMLGRSRRDLLAHLGEPDSAAGLSRKLGLPRQRINYHLRELEKQGFVELVEERRKGNCTGASSAPPPAPSSSARKPWACSGPPPAWPPIASAPHIC